MSLVSDQPNDCGVTEKEGLVAEFFERIRAAKIDWWMIGWLLVSLLSFLGATILWLRSA